MADANGIRTDLKIELHAGEVLVAESTDANLWQKVLAAISSGSGASGDRLAEELGQQVATPPVERRANDVLQVFADDVGVSRDVLIGAMDPKEEAPFLHLDVRCWESFRKNFPNRGRNAVSRMAMVGTLLAMWFRHADMGVPTQAQINAILATLNTVEKNPTRSLNNCDWLHNRNGRVSLNVAEISRAADVTRAFCTKSAPFQSD